MPLAPHHRRALLALLAAYALYRARGPLGARLRAVREAVRRALSAADTACAVAEDVRAYLHPAAAGGSSGVPRSLRRVLRLASSAEGAVVLRNLAGGCAAGVVREARGSGGGGGDWIRDMLRSDEGERFVKGVVAVAVREAVGTVLQFQERGRAKGGERPWLEVCVEAGLSERGRGLIIDVATGVTKVAVPIVVASARASDTSAPTPGPVLCSPNASPARRRRPVSGPSPSQSARCESPMPESPTSRKLVMSMMQAQGGAGVIERLALLAIRDRGLVRDVIRTVASEAIRTYLTTQAELRAVPEPQRGLVASAEDGVGTNNARIAPSGPLRAPASPAGLSTDLQNSLWKVLILSVVTDLKRTMLRMGSKPSSAGWIVF